MKTMERNKTEFWYLLFDHADPILDEYGNETGESRPVYHIPAVKIRENISPAQGVAQVEQFGTSLQYDRVIVTSDMNCPMDEHTVLFIEKDPEFAPDGSPLYDYMVKAVAKSLNSISYAVSKVDVS